MAKTSSAIGRKRKGRVGGEYYRVSGNATIVSELPDKSSQPLTSPQKAQAAGMNLWLQLYNKLLPITSLGWKAFAKNGRSKFNAFVSYNLKNATTYNRSAGTATISTPGIMLTRGKIYPTVFNICQAWVAPQVLFCNWYWPLAINQSWADYLWITLHNETTDQWGCMQPSVSRSAQTWTGMIDVTGVSFAITDILRVYVSWQGVDPSTGLLTGEWSDSLSTLPQMLPNDPNS